MDTVPWIYNLLRDFMGQLWEECLLCQDKCCNYNIATQLFVTSEEIERISALCPDKIGSFNTGMLCPFLTEDQLCSIHECKPIDCRLFPFDLIRVNGKFFWIIRIVRELKCSIILNEERFEEYLNDFEENIIPNFRQHMEDYAEFISDELAEVHEFKVLREVRYR